MDGLSLLRPAGLLERFHITRHYLGFDSAVVVAAQYIVTDDSQGVVSLTRETLYPALEQTIHAHTPLAMLISGANTSTPSFARMNSIDLSRVVRFLNMDVSNPERFDRLLEQEFLVRFDDSGEALQTPLWRITVTSDNVVIFAWHHGIGDGLSGAAFHSMLLRALNNPSTPSVNSVTYTPNHPYIVHPNPNQTLIPALESLTDLTVSWGTLIRAIISRLPPLPFRSTSHIWSGNPVPAEPTLVNYARSFSVSPQQTDRILKLCKQKQTTMTAFLHEVAFRILIQLLQADCTQGAKHRITSIPTSIPISLRRFTKTSPFEMCDQASTYQHTAAYPSPELNTSDPLTLHNFPWTRAAHLSRTLREAAPKSREIVGSLAYLRGRYEDFFKSKLGKKRECGLEVSNLGTFKPEFVEADNSEGSGGQTLWTIGKTFFAQNDGLLGEPVKVNVCGDPLGGLNVVITSGEGALPDGFLDKFSEELKASLAQF